MVGGATIFQTWERKSATFTKKASFVTHAYLVSFNNGFHL